MSHFTTFVCDDCSKKFPTNDLSRIEVSVKRKAGQYASWTKALDWCEECCSKHGLWQPVPLGEKKVPAPTWDTLMAEAISEIIEDHLNDRGL